MSALTEEQRKTFKDVVYVERHQEIGFYYQCRDGCWFAGFGGPPSADTIARIAEHVEMTGHIVDVENTTKSMFRPKIGDE